MKLWPQQTECAQAIEGEFLGGSQKTLAVLATGTGKTIIYLHLADKWSKQGYRVLILAHRRELIHQPVDRAKEFFPKLAEKMGVVMAKHNEADAQVVVATIQTVARNRLVDVEFDYVILDEAHHTTADTYLNLVERFGDAKWLGMTATPFRTDGASLSKVFDSVAYRFPITAAIDQGLLVPFDAYGFTLPASFKDIKATKYGWDDEAVGKILSANNSMEVVYEKWLEYCSERSTICFTASVKQAHATAAYFNSRGVKAAAVDGTTHKKERDKILQAFRSGEIQVVCNCQVWTEGVDVPEASAALMVCPTKSDLAYVQKLGRVLRIYEGKTDAIILDFAPLDERNVVMAGDILGVPRVEKKAAEIAEEYGVLVGASRVDDRGLTASVDPSEVVVEALKYLRQGVLAWSLQEYMTVTSLSDKMMLAIELPNVARIAKAEEMRHNGDWDDGKERLYESLLLYRLWKCEKIGRSWVASFVGSFDTMKEAMARTGSLVDMYFHPYLAPKSHKWRHKQASHPQNQYMATLGIEIPYACTKGQAQQLISHAVTRNAVDRSRNAVEMEIMSEEI